MKAKIRKIATFVEETCTEMDRKISPPTRRAAAVAVIENPCAGKYVEDLSELMTIGEELGEMLTQRAVAALGPVEAGQDQERLGVGCLESHRPLLREPQGPGGEDSPGSIPGAPPFQPAGTRRS